MQFLLIKNKEGLTINTNFFIAFAVTAAAGYLLGSLNFAVLISKYLLKDDVRGYASGNAGMTNMLRTFGVGPAALTALGDFAKGFASAMLGSYLFSHFFITLFSGAYVGMLFAILGHLYPLYFGFKGGKGIMAGLGALVALNPTVAITLVVIFAAAVLLSRMVSLGSVLAAAAYPFITFAVNTTRSTVTLIDTIISVVIALLVLYVHRGNISRIFAGTERKITFNKAKEEKDK